MATESPAPSPRVFALPPADDIVWGFWLSKCIRYTAERRQPSLQYLSSPLGSWFRNQRKAYWQGTLSESLHNRLCQLPCYRPSTEERWFRSYHLLKQFTELHHRMPHRGETFQGVELDLWYKNQRAALSIPMPTPMKRHRVQVRREMLRKMLQTSLSPTDLQEV